MMKPNLFSVSAEARNLLFRLSVLSALVIATGCGKKGGSPIQSLIEDVSVRTFSQNHLSSDDQWIEAQAQLSTGGFALAGMSFPVADPTDPSRVYGSLNVMPNLCSQPSCSNTGTMTLSLNLTEVARVKPSQAVLPNGTPIPISSVQNMPVIELPIGKTPARIYLALSPGSAVMGVAIPFAALDPAGKYLPGVNLFQPLSFRNVHLVGGLFTGSAPQSTGVALFIEISSFLKASGFAPAVEGSTLSSMDESLQVLPVQPSETIQQKLYFKLYQLSRKGLTLKLESDK
ncbi:MAG: hypothetical protein ACO3A2_10335 [Bdellovibrionia bacterium]